MINHHYLEVKSKVESSKKMMSHKDDNFKEVQPYMKGKSVENVRLAFRIRCEMVNEIRGNYKDKYRRIGGEGALICQDCPDGVTQTQSHCLVCPKWKQFRSDLELSNMPDLVKYFQRMLLERSKVKTGSNGAAR